MARKAKLNHLSRACQRQDAREETRETVSRVTLSSAPQVYLRQTGTQSSERYRHHSRVTEQVGTEQDARARPLTPFTQRSAPSVDLLTWNVIRLEFLPEFPPGKEE